MKANHRQFGLTLSEMTVVIAIVAIFVGMTLPAARMLFNSFQSESGTKTMISAALASARAIAAKQQRYAGIRFQKTGDPNNALNAPQYIVFIIQDPNLGGTYGYGFRAVEGIEPIKLPDSTGVMDFWIVTNRKPANPANPTSQERINFVGNNAIDENIELVDTTAFSIVFSPSGKLVMHGVRIRNKNGIGDYASYPKQSDDDIFNKKAKVDAGLAMFYQDDYYGDNSYPDLGIGPEPSRDGFVIYDTKAFRQIAQNNRWNGYLGYLKPVFINPYTGTIINER